MTYIAAVFLESCSYGKAYSSRCSRLFFQLAYKLINLFLSRINEHYQEFIASSTDGGRKTNDGEHTYFPFVSYTRDLVINEFILGDVTHWIADDFGDYTLFTDYDRLELWYTSNPNGVWTKWDCVCEPFENPDNGELWGTYAQGIRFKGNDITARYFVVRAVDPQPDELLFVCNYAAPAAVYNPPAAD